MKYIIEINDIPMTTPELGKKLYKAKGFNSLVFDQNGLDKLEKFETTSMIDKSNFSEVAIKALDERKVGKWVKNEHTFWTCSECGWVNKYNRERYAYCPNCGAKMDKE